MTPTPKDEAKRLIELFIPSAKVSLVFIEGEGWKSEVDYWAKQAALLCVDEMIKEHTHKYPIVWNNLRNNFWKQVKTEIENYQ